MGNNQKSSLKRHSVLYGHSNEYADDFESTNDASTTTTNQHHTTTRNIHIGDDHFPSILTITSSTTVNKISTPTTVTNQPPSSNKRFTVSLGTPTKDKKQRNPNDEKSNQSNGNTGGVDEFKRFSLANNNSMSNIKSIKDDRKSVSLSPVSNIPKHKRLLQLSPHKSSLTSSVSTSSSSNDEVDDIFTNMNPSINIQEIIALLRDPSGMQLFYDFCEQQLCTENIELFKDLEILEQRLVTISSSKRSKHIKSIHDKYLSRSSEMEVNVSHSSRKLVERERFSKKIDVETSKTVLEFLKRDVCANLFDSFSRFIQTKEYRTWRECKCTSLIIKNSLDNFDYITDPSNSLSIDEELTGSAGTNTNHLTLGMSHVSDSTFDPVTITVEDYNI